MSAERPFDPTKPIQTRGGRKVRIICTDRGRPDNCYPVVALVSIGEDGSEGIFCYGKEGRSQSGNRNTDLVNVPVETSTWQNVYAKGGRAELYYTAADALGKRDLQRTPVGMLEHKYIDGEFVTAVFHPSK